METKNLDGETNLKHKYPHKELPKAIRSDKDACQLKTLITCDGPNEMLYKFEGTMTLKDKPLPLDSD